MKPTSDSNKGNTALFSFLAKYRNNRVPFKAVEFPPKSGIVYREA